MTRGHLIAVLLLLIFAQQGNACQCKTLPLLTVVTAQQYDVIFTGQVIAVSPGEEHSRARFKVLSLFRGQSYSEMEVEYDNSSDCALNFIPGETWIIYGNWHVTIGIPRAEMCGHSRLMPKLGEQDYYVVDGRPNYDAEVKWLNDSLGVQAFIDPEAKKNLGHKNQIPDPTEAIVYTVAGLLGLALIFYFVKKMFKRDAK